MSIAEGGLDHFSLGQAPDLTTLGTGAGPVTVHDIVVTGGSARSVNGNLCD